MSKLSLASSPHHHNQRDTGAVMRLVIYACVPGILLQVYFFGYGLIIQIALAIITAIVTEATILELRGKNTERAIKDYSAILAAVLLAISIPPLAPWWVVVIGSFFAVGIVKQLYGGLGYNMFNPAMAAYVMLLISFPVQMTSWLPPTSLNVQGFQLLDAAYVIFTGFTVDGYSIQQLTVTIDGVSSATPLDHVKTSLSEGFVISEALNDGLFNGTFGIGWSTVSIAYLVGGCFLLAKRVINWHIPISMLVSVFLISGILYISDPSTHASPLFHLLHGSVIIGAFFIATDPVSASTTNKGRLIFGAAIGFWTLIIRTYGGYPDAVAFSVVLLNMAVPLIDYYTRPKTYGHKLKAKDMNPSEKHD